MSGPLSAESVCCGCVRSSVGPVHRWTNSLSEDAVVTGNSCRFARNRKAARLVDFPTADLIDVLSSALIRIIKRVSIAATDRDVTVLCYTVNNVTKYQ